ncbi:hypothetical protein HPG69_003415 [Diceros bicornis minor]|uniref:glucuronosyltransferase n=1 Tax=Diceros bicornis minor TaxID=77932 RepID=A0A7J7E8H7_DICBM|nr:hypothetical protein HPG69_003415 [Diceros bicornis minor]
MLEFLKIHVEKFVQGRRDIMDSLKKEDFDPVVTIFIGAVIEKLEKAFVFFCGSFFAANFELPGPTSYDPATYSFLTDLMDFWGQVKDFLINGKSTLDMTTSSGSTAQKTVMKSELWFPLLPNMVYGAGLLAESVKPVPQKFENLITKFGDAGFVLMTLGSMMNITNFQEMNAAFVNLPQGVIWKCTCSHWPKDVKLAANVKIVDWLPQSDLPGSSGLSSLVGQSHQQKKEQLTVNDKSPKGRKGAGSWSSWGIWLIWLFVTHGGVYSIMEAIQHGVPIVKISLFADKFENVVLVEAKNFDKLAQGKDFGSQNEISHRRQEVCSSQGMWQLRLKDALLTILRAQL